MKNKHYYVTHDLLTNFFSFSAIFFTLFQLVFILSKHNLSLGLESSGIQGSFFFF